jgi:hypothetical protein
MFEVGKYYTAKNGDVLVCVSTNTGNPCYPVMMAEASWPDKEYPYTMNGKYWYSEEPSGMDICLEPVAEVPRQPELLCVPTVLEVLSGDMTLVAGMFDWDTSPQGYDHWAATKKNGVLTTVDREYLTSLIPPHNEDQQPMPDCNDKFESVGKGFHTTGRGRLPDSGERSEFNTGAVRDAMTGKGLPSLIPPEAIRRLARRFEDGAAKYGRDNWQKGIPLGRYNDAIIRHTLAAAEGQDDEDHLGAVLWNAAAWIWTESQIEAGYLPAELDDRTYNKGGGN